MDNEEELQDRYLQMKEDYQDYEIIIFRIGTCHHCHRKEVVYECFRDFKFTSCKKRFCEECLEKHYRVDIIKVMNKEATWFCPFKTGKCKCSSCAFKDPNNEADEHLEKLQNEALSLHIETPVFQGAPKPPPEPSQDEIKERLSVLQQPPEREPVWQETLYENGPHQKCTIFIMRNFSQKPGRSAPVAQRIQQALQLNAYILKVLTNPMPEPDRERLELLLQHNLYYLSRNADFCKSNGLISFDTKLNRVHHNTGIYYSDVLSLAHIEEDIRKKAASEYTRFLQQKYKKKKQMAAKKKAKFAEQKNKQSREQARREREEGRMMKEREELDRQERHDMILMSNMRSEIQKLQLRKRELLRRGLR